MRQCLANSCARHRRPWWPMIIAALALAGCGSSQETETKEDDGKPIVRTFERGPVMVSMQIDRDRVRVADPVTLTLDVTADDGVDVIMPSWPDEIQKLTDRFIQDVDKLLAGKEAELMEI